MKERQTLHPVKPGTKLDKHYGTFWKQDDGRLLFAPPVYKPGDTVVCLRGLPDPEWLIENIENGQSFILDHKTSRKFINAFRRLRNNSGRVIRDKARDKEKKRRLALNGRTATAHAAAERT